LCGGDVVDLDNALVGDYTVAKHSILWEQWACICWDSSLFTSAEKEALLLSVLARQAGRRPVERGQYIRRSLRSLLSSVLDGGRWAILLFAFHCRVDRN
jgi:hypothetical protein